MAMFDKHKSAKQNTPVTQQPKASQQAPSMGSKAAASVAKVAMIGHGIHISGDVKSDTNLKIEGRIEGRGVQCTQDIEIAETGHVIASILAKTVKVSGLVSGDIGGSEKVLISRTGRVQGNIIAPRVQLEDGALFRGSIDMNPAEPAQTEKAPSVSRAPSEKVEKGSVAASTQTKAAPTGEARKEPSLNLKRG